MDYSLDRDQQDLRALAADVLARATDSGALDAPDDPPFDTAAWKGMAQAGLLGTAVGEDEGGTGPGPVDVAVVLREVGARAARVPAFATLALGALPVALCGTPEQRAALAPVVTGDHILTAPLGAPGRSDGAITDPATTAHRQGGDYLLDGVATSVPYATASRTLLIPARLDSGGVGVVLLPAGSPGLSHHPQPTGTPDPAFRIGLDGVRVPATALLGGDTTGAAARTLHRCALAGLAATVSGALAGALGLTTEHVKTRRQFGRALAELQAVTMKVGDIYVATRALDAAMWAGAWRLARSGAANPTPSPTPNAGADAPSATAAEAADDTDHVLAAAALLITDQVLDAFYTAQHLHGGLGVDVTYPLHRHFSIGKWASTVLGGPETRLDALGRLAALDAPVHVHAESAP
ncbi:acyl-CoA dehydrogenase [Nocardiopsis gilva YIM 90087]|uniref:Acyl-CoA dehydrogenase n=1 Tax=Nocardiopsis gilva YIM 90087 TaxID=1235441 RepID=A0A223SAQ9_9ACTN|nr:acyl-CoA dehydrogenase family protein [Nocardiopsis gilva]ASU85238.1 acyl-CoA dehydrogenase [Nocardiopsis gilva YIM 90087]